MHGAREACINICIGIKPKNIKSTVAKVYVCKLAAISKHPSTPSLVLILINAL